MTVKWNHGLVKRIKLAAEDGIVDATTEVYEEILHLVQDTKKSGFVYAHYSHKGVHQASAPNESYANETGNALKNTKTKEKGLIGEISANYEYALALELGTKRIAPRPTLRRALDNKRKDLHKIVSKPISKVLKND